MFKNDILETNLELKLDNQMLRVIKDLDKLYTNIEEFKDQND